MVALRHDSSRVQGGGAAAITRSWSLAGKSRETGRMPAGGEGYVASALAIASEIFSHSLVSFWNCRRPAAVSL